MATTVVSSEPSGFSRLMAKLHHRACIGIGHSTAMQMGDYIGAARLRAKYDWLRLAGPVGRLP